MRVLVTGASGMIGRAVLRRLLVQGHSAVALSRHPEAYSWPEGVQALAWDARSELPAGVAADAVVNLVGESVVSGRWTKARMQRIRDSRLVATRRVVAWIAARPSPPPLVSAGAAGYYGARPIGPCMEARPPGDGFLATLARDWETEAARTPGRLVVLRIGHVLSPEGGYLGKMLPFARRHLAGPVAGGQQANPWVHVEDVASSFFWALAQPVSGTYNVVSPGAAGRTQEEFARALADALGKPRQVPIPLLALRLRFGAGASHALGGGQDLRADAIQSRGFRFDHSDLREALQDLLQPIATR